jgi:hypothetical protein
MTRSREIRTRSNGNTGILMRSPADRALEPDTMVVS